MVKLAENVSLSESVPVILKFSELTEVFVTPAYVAEKGGVREIPVPSVTEAVVSEIVTVLATALAKFETDHVKTGFAELVAPTSREVL